MRGINPMFVWVCIMVPIIMIGGLSLWLCNMMNPHVVTFNKSRVVGHFVRQLSQHTLSDAALAIKTKHFGVELKHALDAYAARHHVVILAHSDVLAGGHDITDDVIPMIANRMREKS